MGKRKNINDVSKYNMKAAIKMFNFEKDMSLIINGDNIDLLI